MTQVAVAAIGGQQLVSQILMNVRTLSRIALRGAAGRVWLPWMQRCTLVSALFGLLFACADVAALHWLDVGSGPAVGVALGAGALLKGVVLTASAYGLVGAFFGAATAVWSQRRWSRLVCAIGLAFVLSSVLLANLVSAVLCLYSGSYLTVGSLQFTLNSFAHVSGAATDGHGTTLVLIVLLSLGLCAGLGWLLSRQVKVRVRRIRSPMAYAMVGLPTLVALVGYHGTSDSTFQDSIWGTTPELAFYASLERVRVRAEEPEALQDEGALSGPVLETEQIWQATAKATSGAPNVLLIMLESVSTRFLGHQGDPHKVTPHIDRLAANGLVMRRAWATATHSNYAQMAVLSSLVPRRGLGLDTYRRLDYPRVLLHDALHHLGYSTASISSQDESWQGMNRFQATATPHHSVDARDHHGERVSIGSEQVVPDHETARLAVDWIGAQTKRWSLYVNFQATHFPYNLARGVPRPHQPDQPEPGVFNYLRYPRAEHETAVNRYLNALAYVDKQVGALVSGLRRYRALDNTLIVVTSDHGEMFHEHGLVTHGRTLHEGEARVPLILHWPGGIEAGISDEPVSTLSIVPTVLAAVGAPEHPAHQGTPMISQGRAVHSDRAILLNIQGLRSVEGVVCWPYKLTRDASTGKLSLYELKGDPGEDRNLAEIQPQRALRLHRLLRRAMWHQDSYHRSGDTARLSRFAPRLPRCVD